MSLTAKLMLSPVLVAQALRTRARLPRLPEPQGEREGTVGQGMAMRLLITGDSSAAGVGVGHQQHALAPRLAHTLATAAAARVRWQLRARSGLSTAQTLAWLRDVEHAAPAQHGAQHIAHTHRGAQPAAHTLQADVAVVVTGVNDVVDQIPSRRAVAAREALANWLRNGCGVQHVVFAPLPPIHQFPGLPQPLRWVAGHDAARHNAALCSWATTRSDVSCVAMVVPLNRGVMASDGFHPGEPVYRYCANAIALHIAQRVWPLLHL